MPDFLTLKEASSFASEYLKRNVTISNISYLVQYGKVKKIGDNGSTVIDKNELIKYYDSLYQNREFSWKDKLGNDLNWHLSFSNLTETETTKHVHRLHPYKGKFIPQLVEYFLDEHIDDYKKNIYFHKGDIVLDPFCGSGTTLVQASESGLHSVGIDVSAFNAFIGNSKIGKYNLNDLTLTIKGITQQLKEYIDQFEGNITNFDKELTEELYKFNNIYFAVPDYKYKVNRREIDEYEYGNKYAKDFLKIYNQLISKYHIVLTQDKQDNFLDKWYLKNIREEVNFVFSLVKQINNISEKKISGLILSRTVRSCRATTHSDLATLKSPMISPYYCQKHGKICKPLFSIFSWWQRYGLDTLERLAVFDKLRKNTFQCCLTGDSRTVDIYKELDERNPLFANLVKNQKIKGIFSSPPYVGLIDYHEQHAYVYDLFGFKRQDNLEIGPLFSGQGEVARKSYVEGISNVLINCQKYLVPDYDIFLVANDKYNLYPLIAEKTGMKIVEQFKRPVLNRTERDKGEYSEIIFHFKAK